MSSTHPLTPPLDVEAIEKFCKSSRFAPHLQVMSAVSSTNDLLLESPRANLVLTAEAQSKGRGRREQRSWHSPDRAGIYLSVCLEAPEPSRVPGVGLFVGALIAEVLSALGAGIYLKWPNDLILKTFEKIGGILVEVASGYVVIGLGINTHLSAQSDAPILQPFSSLSSAFPEQHFDRNEIIGRFLDLLDRQWELFRQEGFASFKPLYESFLLLEEEEPVTLTQEGRPPLEAVYLGVTQEGFLRVQDKQGRVTEHQVGELSLRRGHGSL